MDTGTIELSGAFNFKRTLVLLGVIVVLYFIFYLGLSVVFILKADQIAKTTVTVNNYKLPKNLEGSN